jgi:hypothetical protein
VALRRGRVHVPRDHVDERLLLERAHRPGLRLLAAACRVRAVAVVPVAPLRPGVTVEVAGEAQVEQRPARQQPGREVERDAVDVVAQQAAQPHVAVGHQRERGEKVLAELPVADPRRAGRRGLEREGVDQHGPATMELDVVRGCVPEREAVGHRQALGLERCERRVLELPERPLVGIRDESDGLGADDGVSHGGIGRLGHGGRLVGDEQAGVLELAQQAARDQRVPALPERAVDLAQERAVAAIDEAAGVAERCGVALAVCGRCVRRRAGYQRGCSGERSMGRAVASDEFPDRGRIARPIRAIWVRKKNGIATTAAMTAWMIRLPDPGSM